MAVSNSLRQPSPLDADPFALQSITKAEPPSGVDTTNWHRYVITQGHNTIVGHLQGSHASIERSVKEIVERLNERRRGKTGRVHLSPGRKKKALLRRTSRRRLVGYRLTVDQT